MATWLIPALKAILPHVGTIISTATPVFTRKKAEAASDPTSLQQQQIAELQAAASQNATHIKDLASQLETTVAALEQATSVAESKERRLAAFCVVSAFVSALSLVIVLYIAFAR